ncbi:MAG: cyclic nucleotide-binding domain-containing protein, partial [Deltaproteobacteria bacterium]
ATPVVVPPGRSRADTGKHKPARAGGAAKTDGTGRHKPLRADGSPRGNTGRHRALRDADVPVVLARADASRPADAPAAESPGRNVIAPPPPRASVPPAPVPPPPPPPTTTAPAALSRPPIGLPPRASVPPAAGSVRPPSPVPLPVRSPDASAPPPPDTASRLRAPPPSPSLPGSALPRPSLPAVAASLPLPTMAASAAPARKAAETVAVVTLASSAERFSVPPTASQSNRIDLVRALLPSLRCLDELNSDRLRELARQVQVLGCNDGEACFAAGAPAGPLLIVTSGTAQVDRSGAFGFEATIGEGACLGVLGALYAGNRLATARARGPLEAFAFAPSLARSLAREFVAFRRFLDRAATQHATALLPHLSPALRSLSAAAQSRVLEACEYMTVDDGALLQLESAPSRALYFVAAGSVERFGEGVPAGAVVTLGPGALVGGTALSDEGLASWTARSAGSALLARVDRVAYRALVAEFPGVREALRDGPGA